MNTLALGPPMAGGHCHGHIWGGAAKTSTLCFAPQLLVECSIRLSKLLSAMLFNLLSVDCPLWPSSIEICDWSFESLFGASHRPNTLSLVHLQVPGSSGELGRPLAWRLVEKTFQQ